MRTLAKLLIALALLGAPNHAESNDYYTHGSYPAPGSAGSSAGMRAELDQITAGFDKLPSLTGNANKLLIVDGSGTGITTAAGTITIPQAFAITGAYDLTLSLTGTTGLTLPTTGTVATLAGTESLSNKTLPSPTITGSMLVSGAGPHAIGTSTNSGVQTLLGGTLAGNSSTAEGLVLTTTLAPTAGNYANGVHISPTIVEASSGSHTSFSSLRVDPPTVTLGSATVGDSATVRIAGEPSNGDSNYALYVDSGGISTNGGFIRIGVGGTGGSVNPYLKLSDGTSDSYLQIVTGNLDLHTLGAVRLSPGLSEKARVTSDGILLVGSTDTTALSGGGLGLIGGMRMTETSDPATPSSNNLVLYARDDGSGNTVLAVAFPTGQPVTLARENVGIIPPGTVAMYLKSSAVAPSGWLLADGSNVSRTTYSALFSSVGTTFGSGDGSTTFGLPTIANYATNVRFIIKCKAKAQEAWKPTLVPRSVKAPMPWRTIDRHPALAQAA